MKITNTTPFQAVVEPQSEKPLNSQPVRSESNTRAAADQAAANLDFLRYARAAPNPAPAVLHATGTTIPLNPPAGSEQGKPSTSSAAMRANEPEQNPDGTYASGGSGGSSDADRLPGEPGNAAGEYGDRVAKEKQEAADRENKTSNTEQWHEFRGEFRHLKP